MFEGERRRRRRGRGPADPGPGWRPPDPRLSARRARRGRSSSTSTAAAGRWATSTPTTRSAGGSSLAADCMVVSVAYRLGPEDPYPAPMDDVVAAVRWVAEHGGELGGDAEPAGPRRRQCRGQPHGRSRHPAARRGRAAGGAPGPHLSRHPAPVRDAVVLRERRGLLPDHGRRGLVLGQLPRARPGRPHRSVRLPGHRAATCATCRRPSSSPATSTRSATTATSTPSSCATPACRSSHGGSRA